MSKSLASVLGILSVAGVVMTSSSHALADDAAPPAASSTVATWRPGDPAPEGYHAGTHPRWGLVASGVSVFAVFYALSFAASAAGDDKAGFVPVVGPFIAAANARQDQWFYALNVSVDVFMGVVQLAGVSLLVGGVINPKTDLVRDVPARAELRLSPMMMGQGGYGMGLAGRF